MIRVRESTGVEWRPEGLRVVRLERRPGSIRCREALALPWEGDPPLGERLLAALGPTAGPVVLGLPGRQGFLRRLTLPAEDPSLLRSLLEFELERHLPLPVEKLRFDFTVLGRQGAHLWELLLAAAPRHPVDAAVEALSLGGIRPTGATLTPVAIAAVAAMAGAPPGPGLVVEATRDSLRGEVLETCCPLWQHDQPLPRGRERELTEAIRALGDEACQAAPMTWVLWMGEGEREPLETWARQAGLVCLDPFRRLRGAPAVLDATHTAAVGLALQGLGRGPFRLDLLSPTLPPSRRILWVRSAIGAALFLALLGAGLWLSDYRLERRALAKNLAKIQRLGPQVRAVEAEVHRAVGTRRLVEELEKVSHEPSKVALLRELTLLAPRDTWLTRLTYRRGEVEIAGYSGSAQEMIPRLEASRLFRQAGFSGAIEREEGRERFAIRVRLR